ncbi:hypothetical protein MLD38_021626 [Melastoma candidum]|uniref:Uncharacterized protein n=1 Tax=Melastoma candidum TaxID=119954 RepID=A0ACB9QH70_9MYRT|nr:hypothetical protein MLD38_021626 [Melastoma candidum]
MAPSRRKGTSKAAAAAAAARRDWKVGDLVLAKVKGFPAWPATVSDPAKWGYPADWKKVLVYFFGTQQIAFCNPADVEEFSEEKKESLLGKRHGKGADFVRAVREIIESYEKLKQQTQNDEIQVEKLPRGDANTDESSPKVFVKDLLRFSSESSDHQPKCMDTKVNLGEEEPPVCRKDAVDVDQDEDIGYGKTSEEQIIDNVKETRPLSTYSVRRRSGGSRLGSSITKKRALLTRRSRSSSRLCSSKVESSTLPCKDAEHFVGISSSNSVMEASGRRSRRTRRSVDVSKGEDLDSPSISAYSSMEESGSEVVSMDSDDSHGDSAVESGSKHGHSEMAVEP